ncbi:MAG: hypothetical protein AAB392_00360 [Patescibacteria group bacterium]
MSNTSILSYVIITGSVIYAFTIPTFSDISILLNEKDSYEEMIDKSKNIEERKNTLLAEFNNVSAKDVQKIETLIPSSLNFVKLVSDIDVVASKYGIAIDGVVSTDHSNNAESIAEASEAKKLNSATISFRFEANYDKFNSFLDDLERSLRILDIKSIYITSGDKNKYTYQISFDTYWAD